MHRLELHLTHNRDDKVEYEIKYHQSSFYKHALTLVRTISLSLSFLFGTLDSLASYRHKYRFIPEPEYCNDWDLSRCTNFFFGFTDVKIRFKMCAHSYKMQAIKFEIDKFLRIECTSNKWATGSFVLTAKHTKTSLKKVGLSDSHA